MTNQDTQHIRRTEIGRDKEAGGAFTFRRMTQWQVWSITVASVIVLIGLLAYATSL